MALHIIVPLLLLLFCNHTLSHEVIVFAGQTLTIRFCTLDRCYNLTIDNDVPLEKAGIYKIKSATHNEHVITFEVAVIEKVQCTKLYPKINFFVHRVVGLPYYVNVTCTIYLRGSVVPDAIWGHGGNIVSTFSTNYIKLHDENKLFSASSIVKCDRKTCKHSHDDLNTSDILNLLIKLNEIITSPGNNMISFTPIVNNNETMCTVIML